MRAITLITSATAILLALSAPATAGNRITLHPTGNPDVDPVAVQDAVNELSGSDGKIVLKARNKYGVPTAFNFGAGGSVVIDNSSTGSIAFVGEYGEDDDGDSDSDSDSDDDGARTVIEGGYIPILMERRDHLTVRNIEFRGAFLHAILVTATTGARIINNRFLDTIGFPDFLEDPNCNPDIEFCAFNPLTRVLYFEGPFLDPDQITGHIVIRNNIIDTATAGFTDGISLFITNAVVKIAGNRISGVNVGIRNAVFVKPLYAYDNDVSAFVPAPLFFSGGIANFCDFGPEAFVHITNNRIRVADETLAGEAIGIAFGSDDFLAPDCQQRNSLIADNEIELLNGFAGVDFTAFSLGGPSTIRDNHVRDNDVSGNSIFGVFLGSFAPPGVGDVFDLSGNTYVGNEFEDLDTSEETYFLGEATSNNALFIMSGDTFLDLGRDNTVVITDDDDDSDSDGDSDD